MNSFTTKRAFIHPEDDNDVAYWTHKWGVNARQINDAILETGSIRTKDIRDVLIKKGSLGSLWLWAHRFFKGSLTLY